MTDIDAAIRQFPVFVCSGDLDPFDAGTAGVQGHQQGIAVGRVHRTERDQLRSIGTFDFGPIRRIGGG